MYYYNARWYDPTVGWFISEDSVNDPNNTNEFVYVANNPIVNIDPTGHSLGNFISAVGKVSQALNLAAELNPDLKGVASAFSKFAGALSDVRDFVMGAKQVFGQKNIKVTKDKVIVKTKDGGEKVYDKKEMMTEFQKLAELQADKTKADEAEKFETEVKDRYKDYFETVRGNNKGVTVIGLRGWGIGGTEERPTLTDKARELGEHDYDDMLLVLDPKGNLEVFDQVNFEGTSARDRKKKGRSFPYPSITDGSYDLVAWTHKSETGDYKNVMLTQKNSLDTYLPTKEWNQFTKDFTAYGIEIHMGGKSWIFQRAVLPFLLQVDHQPGIDLCQASLVM